MRSLIRFALISLYYLRKVDGLCKKNEKIIYLQRWDYMNIIIRVRREYRRKGKNRFIASNQNWVLDQDRWMINLLLRLEATYWLNCINMRANCISDKLFMWNYYIKMVDDWINYHLLYFSYLDALRLSISSIGPNNLLNEYLSKQSKVQSVYQL